MLVFPLSIGKHPGNKVDRISHVDEIQLLDLWWNYLSVEVYQNWNQSMECGNSWKVLVESDERLLWLPLLGGPLHIAYIIDVEDQSCLPVMGCIC